MFRHLGYLIYGESKISEGCKNCVFECEPCNGGNCQRCKRNTEIPDDWRLEDCWTDISKEYFYFDCR